MLINIESVSEFLFSDQSCHKSWNKILTFDKKNKSVDEILTKTLSYNINIGSQRIINDIVYFRRNEQNISHNDIIEEANMNNGIIEVMHLPGGCMLIKKEAIKIMMDKYPERKYNSCNNEKTYKNSSDFLYNLFDSFIKKYTTNKQYLSEDYGFCELWIKLDRKILAEIAYDNPEAFKTIVKKAQSALN